MTKIYLAGVLECFDKEFLEKADLKEVYTLSSFFSLSKGKAKYIPRFKGFILDSGAFTFIGEKGKGDGGEGIDWEKYLYDYARFIKEFDIKLYFELDIDPIIGVKETEKMRKKLEAMVGYPSIPVWHKVRGYDEWEKMVRSYSYVSIGGIANKELSKKQYKIFPKMLREAERQSCKVHGLGATSNEFFKKYDFFSVDSSTWIKTKGFGEIARFDGEKIKRLRKGKKERKRRVDGGKVQVHNFWEWAKLAKNMEER